MIRRFDLADGDWIVLIPPSEALRVRNQFNPRAQTRLPEVLKEFFGRWPSMT